MNSESELSLDRHTMANLASELVTSALVGLLFGLLGFGIVGLILVQVYTSSHFIAYMTRTYYYRWNLYLDLLLVPVASAVITFVILRPLIDRVRSRKSWVILTYLNSGISILLILWSRGILIVSPVMLWGYLVQPLVMYNPPLRLLLLLLLFVGLAGTGILLTPQNRSMKIVALAISASSFAVLYLITFLLSDIGFMISQSGN